MAAPVLIDSFRHGIFVSCQADPGTPLDRSDHIAALAAAAELGGACGFRVNGASDVAAVRAVSALPIIGIVKVDTPGLSLRITPTLASALSVVEAGAEIVALDATGRQRPGKEELGAIVGALHERGVAVMGDVASVEQGRIARDAGVDMVSCTLAGYTEETAAMDQSGPALDVIAGLGQHGLPVIAEGRIWTLEHAQACFAAGAHALVIGSAITAPDKITRRFVAGTAFAGHLP